MNFFFEHNYPLTSPPALSQYSGDPRTEWNLNMYSTNDKVLEAIRNLRYKGGNTLTGNALFFTGLGILANYLGSTWKHSEVARAPKSSF